jgi:hypothetical protein
MASNILLCDGYSGYLTLSLNESGNGNSRKFRGKFQEANAVNKNKRRYGFDVLNENVKMLQDVIRARGLVGELDHPTDSVVHFEKASHVITKLWWENNVLMGEGEVLNTPHGKILNALINDGVRVGISSRGVGSGKEENGVLVISEGYRLITFDIVADPSTHAAFQQRVAEDRNFSNRNENSHVFMTKNESMGIHTKVGKNALIACLGGLVKSKTANIIGRLS